MTTNIIDPNASTSEDRTSSAMAALKGEGTMSELGDTGSVVTEEDLEGMEVINGSPLDDLFGEGSPEQNDSNESSDDSRQAPEGLDAQSDTNSQGDVEEITVRGVDGRKQKIKVDFGDRDKLLKNAKLAAGARKWQAERDRALSQLDQVKSYEEKATNFDRLSEAYEAGGPLDVLKEMLGNEQAEQWLAQQFDKLQFRQNASEDELKYMDAQEQSERQARELEALRKRQEDYESKVTSEREAAEAAEIQSLMNPIFEKYRFAGKLGDASQEHDLDELVWTRATTQLRNAEEQGATITRELVERAMRSSANRLRKYINTQSEKKADSKIKATKTKALETAQRKVKRGVRNNQQDTDARDMLNRGDVSGFFKNFGKNIKF